jgi:hypothetical protein
MPRGIRLAARYLIIDLASNFESDVMDTVKSLVSSRNERVIGVYGRTALQNDS